MQELYLYRLVRRLAESGLAGTRAQAAQKSRNQKSWARF